MSLNPNQFAQESLLGELDLRFNTNTIPAQIAAGVEGSVKAGQAVKIENTAGGVPKVLPCDSDTDEVFGFIVRTTKNTDYVAGDPCEVAAAQNCIRLRAVGAIDRGQIVTLDTSEVGGVSEATSTKKVVGWSFDKAANGELVRVILDTPSFRVY